MWLFGKSNDEQGVAMTSPLDSVKTVSGEWLGRPLIISTGKIAKQATGSVTVQYGETLVLATIVESKDERAVDFFPLTVEFEERLYAAGIIKGSRWLKREGRPTEDAVLSGRMIDRTIRPLFNGDTRKDTQLVLTVLSHDGENDHDIVSLVAASAAIRISGIEWAGPIAGVRVGRDAQGTLIFNPTYLERAESDIDVIVAGTAERTLMIEAGAQEMDEEVAYQAIVEGQKMLKPAIDLIEELKKMVPAKTKSTHATLKHADEESAEVEWQEVVAKTEKWLQANTEKVLFDKELNSKGERKAALVEIKHLLDEYLFAEGVGKDKRGKAIGKLLFPVVEEFVTNGIIKEKKRVDGRGLEEVRALEAEVSILPRTHGSALFSRGETQVMSVVTLAGPGLEQSMEGIEGTGTKRYMHHYNFPPYSVGEVKNMGVPSRRDIGHGALAEKALLPVLPDRESFPYTIRVVSETMGSNGSSSMASTCGSTLALMDAGVPIRKPVAGVAIGIASNDDMSQWQVITDIQDLEDGKGGMDFKVAGTDEGITAIQLDTKTIGLTAEMVKEALRQARNARLNILKVMTTAIAEPRAEMSQYAPRIISFNINPDKIREVIGSGGKVINEIIAATGVTIDIEDSGLVMICGTDAEKSKQAVDWVQSIAKDFQVGEIVEGEVVRMLDFGAFVQLNKGTDGMVHVSQMAPYRVSKPSDFMNIGDKVTVKIIEIDDKGRVNLSMKDLDANLHLWKDQKGKSEGGESSGGFNRGPRPGGDRPRFGGDRPQDRGPRPPRRD
jgi:polyribonucleotide nucleotidyltransferase